MAADGVNRRDVLALLAGLAPLLLAGSAEAPAI
jgi:hypothetical protein